MRGYAAALALVAVTGCTSGGRTPDPAPTPAPPRAIGGMLAFVTAREVRLAMPDGTVRTIDRHDGTDAETIAWSVDGRYVGWTHPNAEGQPTLYVHEPATGRTEAWSDARLAADDLHATSGGFVIAHRMPGERPQLLVVDPARLFAGGKPRVVRPALRSGVVLTADRRRLLVEQPNIGAAFTGGPSTIYEVTLDGRAKPLVANDRDRPAYPAGLTADGRRLVHGAGDRINPDRSKQWVVVHDLVADRQLAVPPPTVPGAHSSPLLSVETGADGQTVAVVHHYAHDRRHVTELGHKVYVLDGDAWRHVADGASWAATGPSGALAAVSADDAERLTVDGRHLADDVRCAAWAP